MKEKKTDQKMVEEKRELAKPDELIQELSASEEDNNEEPASQPSEPSSSEPSEPVEDIVAAAKPKPPILHAKELLD